VITVHSISKYTEEHPVVITIGTFDGVHIGHLKILQRIITAAKKTGLKSALLTFFPHPRMVLQSNTDIKLLNTVAEKAAILERLGLDVLIIQPFTKDFSRLSATEFVRDILVNLLKSKKIIIGYDHRFGRNRNANIKDLIAFGAALDFEVEEIPAQEIAAISVSSTKIRKALEQGEIRTANAFLGYAYLLTGTIVKGKGVGRTLSFPTANLAIAEEYKQIPKNGVYVVSSLLQGAVVYGMMNIGFNPTVNGRIRSIEIHYFNLDADLYGQQIQVNVLHRLRDEKRFSSLDDLKAQLAVDQKKALELTTR